MKKNITINLCGRLFQIDEDAYELLQQYIESLRSYFGRQEGGDEIVDDIEARIAELFDELKANGTEAITIEHVKDIITRIGKPEEMAGNDENTQSEGRGGHRYDSFRDAAEGVMNNVRARTAGKRLYRNPNDKMLAGVMSGLAAYTNTDPTWWRLGIVLLVLCYGVGILAYIVLAIVLPVAKTPEEQLQMQGKKVTPQALADAVIDEKQPVQQNRGCLGSTLAVIASLFAALFVGIAAIFGFAMLVCLFLVIVSVIIIFTVPGSSHLSIPFDLGHLHLSEMISVHPWVVIVFIAALMLVFLIPLYAIAHMLLSKAGKIQPMGVVQRIFWIVFWVVALGSMVPSLVWIQQNEKLLKDRINERFYTKVDWHANGQHTTSVNLNGLLMKAEWDENCSDNFIKAGEYFTGDTTYYYIDVNMWGPEDERFFRLSMPEEPVDKGTYRISCNARTDSSGVFLYAIAFGGSYKSIKTIPANGREGGMGKGWNTVQMEVEIDGPTTLRYGVTTDPDFTDEPCRATWFSAADFKVERVEAE